MLETGKDAWKLKIDPKFFFDIFESTLGQCIVFDRYVFKGLQDPYSEYGSRYRKRPMFGHPPKVRTLPHSFLYGQL